MNRAISPRQSKLWKEWSRFLGNSWGIINGRISWNYKEYNEQECAVSFCGNREKNRQARTTANRAKVRDAKRGVGQYG